MSPDPSMLPEDARHLPVLLEEVLEALDPRPGFVLLDGTLGAGGHASALMARLGPNGRYIGVDRDARILRATADRLATPGGILETLHDTFDRAIAQQPPDSLDGILLDLGVSSMQLDQAERGFSFQRGGPVDMRMDPDSGESAAALIARLDAGELARLLRAYGEEPNARRVAEAIHRRQPFADTLALAETVASVAARPRKGHAATRTFQALRMAVNDELGCLERALALALGRLRPGGRLAVISFHSLEDRMVKQAMQSATRGCICPPRLPACACGQVASARWVHAGARKADEAGVASNPRARSARLRAVERVR